MASLRKIDTFLASDLEQNRHAVRFDSEQVEIAIEQSETELVRRATEALTRLLGLMDPLNHKFFGPIVTGKMTVSPMKVFMTVGKKSFAALLKQRKVSAEEHESVRLAKDLLGGQVLDVLPR